ncbi:MAG: NifU family protein [Flavobacteriaceae bacterium]|nr:NifU family protein [Flavobacteriaceae bacterium]
MNIKELEINVLKGLDEIRPFLVTDGGDIELVSIDNNIVKVRFLGTCTDCAINKMTLKSGVEATVKKYAPQIIEVLEVPVDSKLKK